MYAIILCYVIPGTNWLPRQQEYKSRWFKCMLELGRDAGRGGGWKGTSGIKQQTESFASTVAKLLLCNQ